ncbi:MAG: AsmA family protein, partial [Deltaproteobacteria bacterium]|nr:AsmA family protein [Deltaproteobacteria bacterium]
RLTGNVRWEDKAPRPVLSGKLSSDRLRLGKLLGTSSKPSPKTGSNELLDRPIKLDGLKKFDARLDLTVKDVADSPIPVADIRSTVMLANGELSARFRGKAVGAPVDGQIMLSQRKNIPAISLKTKIGQIDVGQTLKQLELPDKITGIADAIVLAGSSQGETLRTLLKQASITLQIKPANLSYTGQVVARTINFTFDSAEFFTEKDHPVTAIFSGKLQKVPFNATLSASNLAEMLRADAQLPVRLALKRADEQFNAEITISRPFENLEFDLKHELIGKEIEGLSPLLDFAVPLQGEFHAIGLLKARSNKFTYEEDLRVGKSDIKLSLTVLRSPTSPKITGRIFARELHMDNMRLLHVDEGSGSGETGDKSRVIPDYTIPTDALLTADLDFDIQAKRIRSGSKDLGELVAKVRLKDGWFKSTFSINGFMGSRISGGYDLNAAVKPPLTKLQLNAKDLNYGHLFKSMGLADLLEGGADLYLDLSGSGATRYSFLGDAEGRITVIAGPGKISGRRIDLWAADLIPTMLSTRWRRENVTETNCLVAHIELGEGLAKIEDLLLDTQRIRIAASGILNLETEELDVIVAPRPKRASLVSLANPVRIKGTLAEPEVSVTRIPRGRRLAAAGLLAGLVNPAFLILALSDTGTGRANPCDAAVERAREVSGIDSE